MYKVVLMCGRREFEELCTKVMQEGWNPQGGVAFLEGAWFAQAFTKHAV